MPLWALPLLPLLSSQGPCGTQDPHNIVLRSLTWGGSSPSWAWPPTRLQLSWGKQGLWPELGNPLDSDSSSLSALVRSPFKAALSPHPPMAPHWPGIGMNSLAGLTLPAQSAHHLSQTHCSRQRRGDPFSLPPPPALLRLRSFVGNHLTELHALKEGGDSLEETGSSSRKMGKQNQNRTCSRPCSR